MKDWRHPDPHFHRMWQLWNNKLYTIFLFSIKYFSTKRCIYLKTNVSDTTVIQLLGHNNSLFYNCTTFNAQYNHDNTDYWRHCVFDKLCQEPAIHSVVVIDCCQLYFFFLYWIVLFFLSFELFIILFTFRAFSHWLL